MKKSLVALAALAAVAAHAQSSVQVYGLVDAGVRNDNNVASTTAPIVSTSLTNFANGVLNTSRFGFKGAEDLGAGMKANFVLESGLNAGTGASSQSSTLFDRRAAVGLSGDFGKIDLGRNTTFEYDLTAGYVTDPLGQELVNQNQNTAYKATPINPLGLIGSGLATVRRDNAIKYVYSNSGISAGLMYSLGGIAGNSTANNSTQGFARFTNDMLDVAVSSDQLNDSTGHHRVTTGAGGNVKVSGFKITAGVYQIADDAGFTNSSILTLGTSGPTTVSAYISGPQATAKAKVQVADLGLTYQVTPALNVVGAYYQTQFTNGTAAKQTYGTGIVRARYALSKQTDLYAEVDSTQHSNNANSVSTTNSYKKDTTGLAAGVQVRF
jgi:predicted porin